MNKHFKLLGKAGLTEYLQLSKEGAGYPVATSVEDLEVPKKINALASSKPASGHDCFLKGASLLFDVTATSYQWMQIMRYHFFDIVSSQSKMYCVTKFDLDKQCTENVLHEIIEIVEDLIERYNDGKISLEFLLDNTPQGLMLTARCTSNYLQLKNMYGQRKNHRLEFWHTSFMDFLGELPEFYDLILKEDKK